MINWTNLISRDQDAVMQFARGNLSGADFQQAFSGQNNPARCLVRSRGVGESRVLARKALRRRGLI